MKLSRYSLLAGVSVAVLAGTAIFVGPAAVAEALVPATKTQTTTQIPQAERDRVETIVRDYLLKNPEILLEASKKLQQQEQSKLQEKVRQSIGNNAQELFFTETNPIAGNPNGTTTLVEFFDYQCSHCKTMDPVILGLIKSNPQLRIIFKPWPIFGATSEYAAKAVLAAHEQGKFLPFHEALMQAKSELNPTAIMQIAKTVGLNTQKLATDMKDTSYAQQLQDNGKLAIGLGSQGTPTFVLAAIDPQAGPPKPGDNKIKAVFIPGGTSQATLQKLIDEISGKK
jgi:protein-disulfide isomerase